MINNLITINIVSMEWNEIIRSLVFPIGMTFLIVTKLYLFKIGERKSVVQQRNMALVLLLFFIIIIPFIFYLDDRQTDILINGMMGGSAILGFGYFLYYLPKMIKYFFTDN